uniref:Chemosensory protein n=1 Tax=Eogystia hippophaecolus TaxID=1206364 RepID=A0A1B3P5J5_EOGHI|nr:chemosensory protein [Eogystia hippophaecolus]
MRSFIVICLLALVGITLSNPIETYTDRFDHIDLDEILDNRRLLIPYIKCMLDQGKCSPDGKEIKKNVVEALEHDCHKCTPTQKKGTKKIIRHLINKENDYWIELSHKYDPDRHFVGRYENELTEH